ncbi:MAG: 16S rRNA (cytosine(1402)-N(4))-methyltransferase RsmH [Patescibacteria group bacterium]
MEKTSKHISVLGQVSTDLLKPTSNGVYLDGTFGGGGHSKILLEKSRPSGRVVALDRDPGVEIFAETLAKEFAGRLEWHCLSFDQVGELGEHFDGAILDLGMSSDQLEEHGRGFSFRGNQALDLRFDDRYGQTAAQLLMQEGPMEIERVFRDYGEDRYAKKLAVRIVNERRARPIRTTADFISYVGTDNPRVLAPLFQALRIAVNDEVAILKRGLTAVSEQLNTGAVLAVISFHSLEDRIVKNFFRQDGWETLTKQPLTPDQQELADNPRSRSAKLRAAKKSSST